MTAQPFQGWVRSTEDPTSPERDGRQILFNFRLSVPLGETPAQGRQVVFRCNHL